MTIKFPIVAQTVKTSVQLAVTFAIAGVNFINVFCAPFSYERLFSSYVFEIEPRCFKLRTKNIVEVRPYNSKLETKVIRSYLKHFLKAFLNDDNDVTRILAAT